jgi:hypothetical protein
MPFSELFDETLDIHSTSNYKLSIQANLDGFYFSLFDTLRRKVVLLRSYEPEEERRYSEADIVDICQKDDFLRCRYESTGIIVPALRSTIIPAGLYDPAGRNDYFLLNNELTGKEIIKVCGLKHPGIYILFSLGSELAEVLSDNFPGVEPVHHLKPLIHHLHTSLHGRTDSMIHLHVEREFITIVHYDEGEMKLCNSFEYRSISDLLYYLLYVVRKSEMPAGFTLMVSGATVRFDEIWSELSGYVSNIRYSQPTGGMLFSHVFGDEVRHRHLTLFTLVNCA